MQAHTGSAKNNATDERGEPGNDGVQHYQLRQNKYLPCLWKLHIYQSDTRATGRHQTHHCSIAWLSALGQRHSELLVGCVPRLLPSPKYIWFCDLRPSEYRFCFFITNESEDLIHFGFFDFLWDGRMRQCLCHIGDPQRDGLR